MPRPGDAQFANPRRQVQTDQPGLSRSEHCPRPRVCQPGGRSYFAGPPSRGNALSIEKPSGVGWRMKDSKSQASGSRKVPSARLRKFGLHWALGFGILSVLNASNLALAGEGLVLNWTNNLLTISSPKLPGGQLDIWYLEAFCRKGSTHRDWGRTTLPHKTGLLSGDQHHLRFRTTVQPEVEVLHD